MFKRLVIIGVGLIGGSVGLAAKRTKIADTVVGVGRNPEHLNLAVDCGAIDSFTTDVAEGVKDADLIILCLPVEGIVDFLPKVAAHAAADALVTDVGSTKKIIVEKAESCFGEGKATFIGSHPLTGSEKTGVTFAKADLFKGATCFVTVTDSTPREKLQPLVMFWRKLGARPFILRPERHDYLVGTSSHAVHLTAASLVRAVGSMGEDPNLLRLIVGSGFKDTTRLALGNVELWVEICRHNAAYIADALDKIQGELGAVKDALAKGDFDFVKSFLERARSTRLDL